MIGTEVFYLDPKGKEVRKAICTGINVSQNGYVLVSLNGKHGKLSLEEAHVWTARREAEEHMKRVMPFILEAEKLMGDAKEKIDALRIKVIGEPKHLKLAQSIISGR